MTITLFIVVFIEVDDRNVRAFLCNENDADHNAAMNLEYLGLAGIYSLSLLPN